MSFAAEEAHHILHVIRMVPGELCRVVDGQGGRFVVRLERQGERLHGVVVEAAIEASPVRLLDLGFPILRTRSRIEWLLEKAVEVGVDRLVPILWSRGLKKGTTGVRPRWERILLEAMKQSERARLPSIAADSDPLDGAPGTCLVLADPMGVAALPDLRPFSTIRLLVGPEGGPTEEERVGLREQGVVCWSLGSTRLRAETAAIVGSHGIRSALRALEDPEGR